MENKKELENNSEIGAWKNNPPAPIHMQSNKLFHSMNSPSSVSSVSSMKQQLSAMKQDAVLYENDLDQKNTLSSTEYQSLCG